MVTKNFGKLCQLFFGDVHRQRADIFKKCSGQDDVERLRSPIFGTSKDVRLHFDDS